MNAGYGSFLSILSGDLTMQLHVESYRAKFRGEQTYIRTDEEVSTLDSHIAVLTGRERNEAASSPLQSRYSDERTSVSLRQKCRCHRAYHLYEARIQG